MCPRAGALASPPVPPPGLDSFCERHVHRRTSDSGFRRWRPRSPFIIAAAGGVLAVAAFLARGPIGLRNGPLDAGVPDTHGWAAPAACGAAWPARQTA